MHEFSMLVCETKTKTLVCCFVYDAKKHLFFFLFFFAALKIYNFMSRAKLLPLTWKTIANMEESILFYKGKHSTLKSDSVPSSVDLDNTVVCTLCYIRVQLDRSLNTLLVISSIRLLCRFCLAACALYPHCSIVVFVCNIPQGRI